MFEAVINFFRNLGKTNKDNKSKDAAKERLHLVLMQDRANISADFLSLMKQEIIEVIKKYIDVDENAIDVRLTNKANNDGTTGAPVLYANIPIVSVKEEAKEEAKKAKAEAEKMTQKENKSKKENVIPQKEEITNQPKNKKTKKEADHKEEKKEDTNHVNPKVKEKMEDPINVIEKAEEIVEEVKKDDKEEKKD